MEIAKHNSRSHEDLCLSTVGTVLEARAIRFDLRPEFLGHVILESIVPGERSADLFFVTCWKSCSKGSLNIKFAEAFPIGDHGGNDGFRRTVLILAGGKRRLEVRRKNIIAMLFVGGDDSVFQNKAPVSEPVLYPRIVVHDVRGRRNEKDLDMSLRDQFEALTAIIVFGGNPIIAALPENVVPVYLQEAGGSCRHRREPVGLFRLGACSHLEPIFKEAATLGSLSRLTGGTGNLRVNQWSCAKIDRQHQEDSQACPQGFSSTPTQAGFSPASIYP